MANTATAERFKVTATDLQNTQNEQVQGQQNVDPGASSVNADINSGGQGTGVTDLSTQNHNPNVEMNQQPNPELQRIAGIEHKLNCDAGRVNKLTQMLEDFMKTQKAFNDNISTSLNNGRQPSNVNPNLNTQPPANGQSIFVTADDINSMLTEDERQNFGVDYAPLTAKIANAAAAKAHQVATDSFKTETAELKGQIEGMTTRLATNDRSRAESEVLSAHPDFYVLKDDPKFNGWMNSNFVIGGISYGQVYDRAAHKGSSQEIIDCISEYKRATKAPVKQRTEQLNQNALPKRDETQTQVPQHTQTGKKVYSVDDAVAVFNNAQERIRKGIADPKDFQSQYSDMMAAISEGRVQ